jgi:DNA-binding NarL/FixJ family response regulator
MSLSILIVDDERVFRDSVGRLLSLRGFQIAGQAGDGAEAVRLARSLEPNAVLLDVNLPDASGFDVARELARLPARPRVLLTSADVDVTEQLVSECGAAGFIHKDELPARDLSSLLGLPDGER